MAHAISYFCDHCKRPIGEPYGPLFVSIASETEPQVNTTLELCSYVCLAEWAAKGSPLPDHFSARDGQARSN